MCAPRSDRYEREWTLAPPGPTNGRRPSKRSSGETVTSLRNSPFPDADPRICVPSVEKVQELHGLLESLFAKRAASRKDLREKSNGT